MKKNRKNNTQIYKYFPIFAALILGFGLGMILKPQPTQLNLVTTSEKDSAKQEISRLYQDDNTIKCADPTDPIKPQDRGAVFNKYLKINGYANRAVIRGCNDLDRLLAKTKQGNWVLTDVNVTLDARVNPNWQKECLIQDITVSDTEIRPENTFIDDSNFQECQKLKDL